MFDLVYQYKVTCSCDTPLRVGAADGDTRNVLRLPDNTPFIQGASLAGVMRAWLEAKSDNEILVSELFGDQKKAGTLMISDGLFERTSKAYTRMRLRINPQTATAATKAKFDVAHIAAGSVFVFTVTWLGTAEPNGSHLRTVEAIEQMLSALQCKPLGAQKTNGFGKLSINAERCILNMYEVEERKNWLENSFQYEKCHLPTLVSNDRVTFELVGNFDRILVKSGHGDQANTMARQRVQSNVCEQYPLIPGSSIKGVLRNRCAVIADAVGISPDYITQMFGAEGTIGKFVFYDAVMKNKTTREISRIRINKHTGQVCRHALLTEEPVSAQTVTIRIEGLNDPAMCGLLYCALRDLTVGHIGIGSGQSFGRGLISNACLKINNETIDLGKKTPAVVSDWLTALKGVCAYGN